ncbi:unnamed protein product, partial [Sphacelaria rigidula]
TNTCDADDGADDDDGGEGVTVKSRGWQSAISTSTLPFGAYSLPQLAPSGRKELENRYLSTSAHISGETQEAGLDGWLDKTTWSRSIGSSLLT